MHFFLHLYIYSIDKYNTIYSQTQHLVPVILVFLNIPLVLDPLFLLPPLLLHQDIHDSLREGELSLLGYDNLGHNLVSVIKQTNKTELGAKSSLVGHRWFGSTKGVCGRQANMILQTIVHCLSVDCSLNQHHKTVMS